VEVPVRRSRCLVRGQRLLGGVADVFVRSVILGVSVNVLTISRDDTITARNVFVSRSFSGIRLAICFPDEAVFRNNFEAQETMSVKRLFLSTLAFCLALAGPAVLPADEPSPAGATSAPDSIVVEIPGEGDSQPSGVRTKTFSFADLDALPRTKVELGTNKVSYEGVELSELLQRAGVVWEKGCSSILGRYVLVEAADGYGVVFAIPEIDPGVRRANVILANRCEGQPLRGNEGPLEIIEENAKSRGRCVRQAAKISVKIAHDRPKKKE